jgi:hypothetical protein
MRLIAEFRVLLFANACWPPFQLLPRIVVEGRVKFVDRCPFAAAISPRASWLRSPTALKRADGRV